MAEVPKDNIFGRILAGEIPSHEVYSNEDVYCFLDIFPQALGHTLVIPRNFSRNLEEASVQDVSACLAAVRKLMPAVRAATSAKGITVISNTGRDAGQMIEYLHFHIVPRYKDDHVSLHELGGAHAPEDLEAMAEKIRGLLG